MYEKQDRFQFVVVPNRYFVHILTDVILYFVDSVQTFKRTGSGSTHRKLALALSTASRF